MKPTDSMTWKGISRSFNFVKGGYGWSLENRNQISFWFDIWLYFDHLCLIVDDIDPDEVLITVVEVISPQGECNTYKC